MSLMEEIEKARKRLGVTAAEVARRAGFHASTYTAARAGGNTASVNTQKAFLRAVEEIATEQAHLAERARRVGNPPNEERKVA